MQGLSHFRLSGLVGEDPPRTFDLIYVDGELSLSLSHTHSLSHTLTHSLSHFHTLSLAHTQCFSLSHRHALLHSHTLLKSS